MDNHFLTTKYYVKGSILNFLDGIFPKKYTSPLVGYKKTHNIKNLNDRFESKVEVFKYNKKDVLIKSIAYNLKNLGYEKLVNEAEILKTLSKLNFRGKHYKVHFPKLIDTYERNNTLFVVREYIDGESIKHLSKAEKVKIVIDCIASLKHFSKKINNSIYNKLPKKTLFLLTYSYILYLTGALMKSKRNMKIILLFTIKFYSLLFNGIKIKYVLSHKDLKSRNILYKNGSLALIDLEYVTLADELTDFSIITRVYLGELSKNTILNLIKSQIKTKEHYNKYLFLTIYYTIQVIAIGDKLDLENAESYIKFLYEYVFALNSTYIQ